MLNVFPEVGTRQHCCDNLTMFSGPKIVDNCIKFRYIRCVVATPYICLILFCHWSSITLSRVQLCLAVQYCRAKIVNVGRNYGFFHPSILHTDGSKYLLKICFGSGSRSQIILTPPVPAPPHCGDFYVLSWVVKKS